MTVQVLKPAAPNLNQVLSIKIQIDTFTGGLPQSEKKIRLIFQYHFPERI